MGLETILFGLLIWFIVSIPAGVAVGRRLAKASVPADSEPPC